MDLQLPVQSVPITTKCVSSNSDEAEVYSIQLCVIQFVSDLWQVGDFFWVLRFPPPIDHINLKHKKKLNSNGWQCHDAFFFRPTYKFFNTEMTTEADGYMPGLCSGAKPFGMITTLVFLIYKLFQQVMKEKIPASLLFKTSF